MLYQLEELIEGLVIKRPSKFIKTPYVADVLINDNSELERKEIIAHSASLGCCGLADANARVLMSAMPPSKTKNPIKCSHRIYLSVCKEGTNEEIELLNCDEEKGNYVCKSIFRKPISMLNINKIKIKRLNKYVRLAYKKPDLWDDYFKNQ